MSSRKDAAESRTLFKYFRIFVLMLAGQCTVRFLFQQRSSYEVIFEVIIASLLTAFFWWLFDWSASKEIE